MSNLLTIPEARDWVKAAIQRHSNGIYGEIKSAVIWTNEKDINGELIVPVDPTKLVAKINDDPFIILHNHDPGMPKGQMLESAYFQSDSGEEFVAAVLGFYAGGDVLEFANLNFDLNSIKQSPKILPPMPLEYWIELAVDPREVDTEWLDQVTAYAPLRVKHTELSHNALEVEQELIRLGLGYLAIVWNPFVTAVASEAGKRTYAALHEWLSKLLRSMADRRNPLLAISSSQDGCLISFLLRGKDVKQHDMAHKALSGAGVQALELITKLKERGNPAKELIYEWDKDAYKWYPTYAVLSDKRIIVDRVTLIALERIPTELSLGIRKGNKVKPAISPASQAKKE